MAKFFGDIAFKVEVEKRPGVVVEETVIRKYYGDLTKNPSSRIQQLSGTVNDKITISNAISIISDPFVNEHFHEILYVEFMGAKWKVTNVEIQFPRLILTTGEVYNGEY